MDTDEKKYMELVATNLSKIVEVLNTLILSIEFQNRKMDNMTNLFNAFMEKSDIDP
ncbi:MAG: hypothetical protein LBU99_07105 [Spirochaetaceae bacterium]|jgi:hypothetical protein|nr:hypothetical protein [Spirochaetaceae bacterium]